MLIESLGGIREQLQALFPDVSTISINVVPDPMVRPSCSVVLAESGDTHEGSSGYSSQVKWDIVYYAPLGEDGKPSAMEQLSAADRIRQAFMDLLVLPCPGGDKFRIAGAEGGFRDGQAYIRVTLENEYGRAAVTHEKVHWINMKMKEV